MNNFDDKFDKATGRLKSAPSCPHCGKDLDRYTQITLEPAKPKAGDVSICLYCGYLQVFAGRPLTLREPTAKERQRYNDDEKIKKVLRAVLIERSIRPVKTIN